LTLSCLFPHTAQAQVATTPTIDEAALTTALNANGLTITRIRIRSGTPGQIGTFQDFSVLPVTIRPGIVMSSGSVADLSPLAEALDPEYNPAGPPARVNSDMSAAGGGVGGGGGSGGTGEFDDFGNAGHIENFGGSFDVASIEVRFTLPVAAQVQFDFLFGSVEFPVYTSSYTDAFLVFLDGVLPTDQIAFDANGNAVQVGASFAGLETTSDQNSAFASPHAMIHHLTTTTATLAAGSHTLTFEVGDVNDHVLDSAVFISNLRAINGGGGGGTGPTEDCPADLAGFSDNPNDNALSHPDGGVDVIDLLYFLHEFEQGDTRNADLDDGSGTGRHDNSVDINDLLFFLAHFELGC
jgi:hypothetical protein